MFSLSLELIFTTRGSSLLIADPFDGHSKNRKGNIPRLASTSERCRFFSRNRGPERRLPVTRELKRNWLNKRVSPRLNLHSRTRFAFTRFARRADREFRNCGAPRIAPDVRGLALTLALIRESPGNVISSTIISLEYSLGGALSPID